MRIDRVDKDLIGLFGLIALVTFAVASVLSYGVLQWGDVVSVYLHIGIAGVAAVAISIIVLRTVDAGRAGRSPLAEVLKGLGDLRLLTWLVVPGFIAPIFMASFTIAKTLIGIKLGFTWDSYFADLDEAMFGADPWLFTHAVFGTIWGTAFLQFFYVGWGAVVILSMSLVIVVARREHAATFLLAMFLTWAVAGLCLAALFSSAGPCFAYEFDPKLGERFAPLNHQLTLLLEKDSAIRVTQQYLAKYWNAKVAVKGGGISAFPSVHVAVTVIYVIASWRVPLLRYASLTFAALIWIGSIHFGYHYAVDGVASLFIGLGCWFAAGKIVTIIASRHHRSLVPA